MPSRRLTIEFAAAALKAPAPILERARAHFAELVETLTAIPEGSAFWDSLQVSDLSHTVDGWSFRYRVDGQKLWVYDARE